MKDGDRLGLLGLPRAVRSTALGARGGRYLPYDEDITTPWTMDSLTCNELLEAIDGWCDRQEKQD